jgi:hypothetical protein
MTRMPAFVMRLERAFARGRGVTGRIGVIIIATGAVTIGAQTGASGPPAAITKLAGRADCRVSRDVPPGDLTAWVTDSRAGLAHAAWCRRQHRGRTVFDLLVAAETPTHPWARCEPHVRVALESPFPYLRAIMLPEDLPYPKRLNEFAYFTGESYWLVEPSRVESDGVPRGLALDFGFGDAGQILLCHGGKWIIGGYH